MSMNDSMGKISYMWHLIVVFSWIYFVVIECNMDALMLPDNYAYNPEESRFDDVIASGLKSYLQKMM